MNQIQVKFEYHWETVFLRDGVEYLFPLSVSPFMRTKYREPAVFKWDIHDLSPGDKKLIYIGEAPELCPRRIYSYLVPGPTQTANKKVNVEFKAYLKEHLKISLEICRVQNMVFGDRTLDGKAFNDKHVRRLLVESLIIEYQQKGYTVPDL